jgi:Tfp pilus assembly protein PilF
MRACDPGSLSDSDLTATAQLLFEQHKYGGVVDLLQKSARLSARLQLLLGRSQLKTGMSSQAVESLTRATETSPEDWETHFYAGCACAHIGEFDRARRSFTLAIERNPDCGRCFLQRGHAHQKQGELHQAWRDYLEAERLGLTFGPAAGFESIGLFAATLGDHALARQALARAFQRGRRSEPLLYYLGWSSLQQGRFTDGVQAWSLLAEQIGADHRLAVEMREQLHAAQQFAAVAAPPPLSVGLLSRAIREQDFKQAADGLAAPKVMRALERLDETRADQVAAAVATLYVMADMRSAATGILELRQRRDATSHCAAHGLFLIGYWDAIATDKSHANGMDDESRQRLIRNAVMLLTNESFWSEWTARRQQTYGVDADSKESGSQLRSQFERFLLECWPLETSTGLHLRIELAGARALQAAGGLTGLQNGSGCQSPGPAAVVHFGFQDQLAARIRAAFDQEAQESAARRFTEFYLARLRGHFPDLSSLLAEDEGSDLTWARYFSQLAEAQVLVEYGRPQDAVNVLPRAACRLCVGKSAGSEGDGIPFCICREDCDRFRQENPGFAQLEYAHDVLRRHAALLCCDAHLALADRPLTTNPINVETCLRHWHDALAVARRTHLADRVEKSLGRRAQGRAVALLEQRDADTAIEILCGAHAICEGAARDELAKHLADAYFSRAAAVSHTVEGKDERAARDIWANVEGDLRRCLELNPVSLQILRDFPRVLVQNADEYAKGDPLAASRRLLEARKVAQAGLQQFPQDEELHCVYSAVMSFSPQLVPELLETGDRLAAEEKHCDSFEHYWAAHELRRGVGFAARRPLASERICRASAVAAFDLVRRGRRGDAGDLVERVLEDFAGCEDAIPLHLLKKSLRSE